MGVMRDLNQHLKKRGNRWHYVRRVPKEYQFFDKRGTVYKSLKTESLELARARRDALMEADNQYWASVMAKRHLAHGYCLAVLQIGTATRYGQSLQLNACPRARMSPPLASNHD